VRRGRRSDPPAIRVLYVTAELYPWVKTGGLGDVAAALPPALVAQGANVRLLVPGFPAFIDAFRLSEVARLRTPFTVERARLSLGAVPGSDGVSAYVIDHPGLYDRPGGPYVAPDGGDWGDNHRRFAMLGWVAAALARGVDPDWRPDIVHGHDWHAGLAPAYLAADPPTEGAVRSVFTIHNIAYQGFFPASLFPDLALPPALFATDGVEFYGGIAFMKAGLFYADRLTTVSPTYAQEIQTPAFGVGLDGLLRTRAAGGALTGILNGVDPQVWAPEHDPVLPRPYGLDDTAAGKAAAKAALQRRLGLANDPAALLVGAVARLTPQKGLDLLLASVPALVAAGAQLALLGSGDGDLEYGFAAAASANPGRVGVQIGYDDPLSHLIIGGSDIVAVPSRFEPCGLTQLYALRYGALPLVRRVGGLADTVVDANAVTLADGSATGFVFDDAAPAALQLTLQRASALFADRNSWRRMMRQAMTRDFSWEAAARRYVELYRELIG
jgi:starch synthase